MIDSPCTYYGQLSNINVAQKKPTAVVMLVYLLYLFGTTIHACQYVFAEKFYINIHTCFLIKD